MKKKFKSLEPCSVGGIKVKVLASGEHGKGWRSPCPQLYIDIGKTATGASIIGYENVKKIRDMCNHALSKGAWDNDSTEKKEQPCTINAHKWKPSSDTQFICEKCGKTATKAGPQPTFHVVTDKETKIKTV